MGRGRTTGLGTGFGWASTGSGTGSVVACGGATSMPIKAGGVTGAARCASDWATQYKAAAWTAQTSSKGGPLASQAEACAGGDTSRRV